MNSFFSRSQTCRPDVKEEEEERYWATRVATMSLSLLSLLCLSVSVLSSLSISCLRNLCLSLSISPLPGTVAHVMSVIRPVSVCVFEGNRIDLSSSSGAAPSWSYLRGKRRRSVKGFLCKRILLSTTVSVSLLRFSYLLFSSLTPFSVLLLWGRNTLAKTLIILAKIVNLHTSYYDVMMMNVSVTAIPETQTSLLRRTVSVFGAARAR